MIGDVLNFYESKNKQSNFFKINYTHIGIGGKNGKEANDNRII